MIRQLLALIALITGLAAVAQPVQARIVPVEAVGQALARDMVCQKGTLSTQLDRQWTTKSPEPPKICPRPQIVIIVPPVMLQVDRARE